MKESTKIIRAVKKTANNEEFQSRHIINIEKNFKRERKLKFSDVIFYIISNTKQPTAIEAERFSECICEEVSAAALCKARKKSAAQHLKSCLK